MSVKHLVWIDIETTGLPTYHDGLVDFSGVHLLEIGCIVTDTALNIVDPGGYTAVVKMTKDMAAAIRSSEIILKMHRTNGLLTESVQTANLTMEMVDQELSEFLSELKDPEGSMAIAGSGVIAFDLPFIKSTMPKTAKWLDYFGYDIGVMRRLVRSMAGQHVVNPNTSSYGPDKAHRAMNDVEAHLREAQSYRDWFRTVLT